MAKNASSPNKRLASMTDVAAHAGVSVMTVSNVINRPEIVSERKRELVLASMRELNYRNNLVARSLRLAQPRQIAYSLDPRQGIGNQYMDEFLHCLAIACQENKRNLTLVAESSSEAELEACDDLYHGRVISGVVISDLEWNDPRPLELSKRNIPFVAYGRTSAGEKVPWTWVATDVAHGIELAVNHLVGLGHSELAFVGYSENNPSMMARFEGYVAACKQHSLDTSTVPSRIIAAKNDIGSGMAAARELLETSNPPTGLVCVSDPLAAGAVSAVQETSKVPGTEVAVTGFDDSPLTTFGRIGITSVRQPAIDIARALVSALIDQIEEPHHTLLEPSLIIRESTTGIA